MNLKCSLRNSRLIPSQRPPREGNKAAALEAIFTPRMLSGEGSIQDGGRSRSDGSKNLHSGNHKNTVWNQQHSARNTKVQGTIVSFEQSELERQTEIEQFETKGAGKAMRQEWGEIQNQRRS